MNSDDEALNGCMYVPQTDKWQNVGRIKGDKGDTGQDGAAGKFTELRYAKNGSTTTPPALSKSRLNPSGWTTEVPTVASLEYLWQTTAVKSGDGKTLLSQWSNPVRVTPYNGFDGQDGADGKDGTNGRGIRSVTEYYGVSQNSNVRPTVWSISSVPTLSETNKYLWNYERIFYTDGSSVTTPAVIIGCYGDKGRGIVSITEMYLATNLSTGVTKNTIGWSSSVQDISASRPYLYNYEIIKYSDNTTEETDVALIGRWGADGSDGQDGRDGVSAASVYRGEYSSTKRYYGNPIRVDIVKYNSAYYISRVDAPNGSGGFTGVAPTNTNYWNAYGASFESVATSLLMAELANIAGFIFRNNRLESQTLADGSTTDGATSKTPMVFLNGLTGQVSFAGGKVVLNSDGTVNIGNGKFTVDKDGNVTMKNVTMNDIIANNGTFTGRIKAHGGLGLGVDILTGEMDVMGNWEGFVIGKNSSVGGYKYETFIYLPSEPMNGQVFYARNMNPKLAKMKLICNGRQGGIIHVTSNFKNYGIEYNNLKQEHEVSINYGHTAMLVFSESENVWHMVLLD
jgi:hypothetical protein